mgnify:CR=1 FL=1
MELLYFFFILYFVPAFVAITRKVGNWGSAVVINVFLGWTIIGWAISLAMACASRPKGN